MRLSASLLSSLLLLAAGTANAAHSWGFGEGSVSVVSKKGGDAIKESLNQKTPLSSPVKLGSQDSLKIILTAQDNGKGKRPHQAFVLLQDAASGLEAPFPLDVKESGKATVSISQKDIPTQLLAASKPLRASVVIASFGSAEGLVAPVFDVEIQADPNAPAPSQDKPLRYGKLAEIHHTFRADPKSPPKVVSLFFSVAVLATVPALVVGWLLLGANLDDLQKAMGQAPLSHGAFFASIITMEFIFFLYYTSWNLFQVLPLMGLAGTVSVLSGTKALGEVQQRRLEGRR